ncbi:MAG TPA: phosphate acyltransferase PlsX [Dehalococcoidia bacterium]|nr:phosphate acyltransferase PlsX [Dehalococcoidia bacterium]
MVQNGRVRVAVDAMGGDYAPEEIVKGAVLAAQKGDVEIFLVGSTNILEKELAKYKFTNGSSIHVVEASEVIKENESPVDVVRRKPNCSVAVAAKMVKSGEADALVSAGSSAAAAISAIQFMGMLDGMYRPAIVGSLGSFAPNTVVVDLGANVDCKPHQFLAFAIAGSVYAKRVLNITDPKIALLSTGSEENKGSEAVREAYSLLKNSGLNFVGNIEGNDILNGKANVIVCDGFVGNVLLKFYESIGGYAQDWTARKLKKYPPLRALVRLLFKGLFPATKISSETEKRGGGILWGVDGVVRIAHGASRAPQIANAIESAREAVKAGVIESLKSELAKFNQGGKL